jgi:Na+/H+ antiporter NhaD/arsenite permease-like protein
MLTKAKTPRAIMAVFVIGMGVLSAFLVNDTMALVGVPIIIYISKHMAIKPKPLLISLAFGISIGSIMTPIGNPQNLLISRSSLQISFFPILLYSNGPFLHE